MDRLEALSTFLCVVETGSFAAAAEVLGIDRAVATRRVAALEKTLGLRLLQRSTRRLKLTPEGDALLKEAFALDQHACAFFASEHVRMLRVRCSHSLGAFGAVGLLEDFAREHPGLSVEIQTSENLSPVVETGADLVLRVVQTPEPGVVAHKLGDCDSMYVASPAYASGLDILDPLQWSDIRLLPLEHETHWLVDGVTVPITARNAPVRYGTAWFAYRAALAGQGVARLPSMALREDLASGKLVALATAPSSGLSVWALLPSRRWIKPEIRLLLKRLEAHYGQPSNKRSDG